MKKNVVVLAGTLLAAAAIAVVLGASTRETLTESAAWEKFAGTWENASYEGKQPWVQKLVIEPGLSGEDWLRIDSAAKDATWSAKPNRFWTDPKGNLFFQFTCTYPEFVTASLAATGTGRVLYRLDSTGQTLEITAFGEGARGRSFPEEIDPTAKCEYGTLYYIYHRKQ